MCPEAAGTTVRNGELLTVTETAVIQETQARDILAIEGEQSSCSMNALADEPLAEIVIEGVRKFRAIVPHIIELRKRFSNRPRGKAGIAGCQTWTEFCEKRLGACPNNAETSFLRTKNQ